MFETQLTRELSADLALAQPRQYQVPYQHHGDDDDASDAKWNWQWM